MYQRVLNINGTDCSRRVKALADQLGVDLDVQCGGPGPSLSLRTGAILYGEADVTRALETIAARERR